MPSPIFDAPLTTSLVPTTAGNPAFTFTRATTAYALDHENILRQAIAGEARFQGARRVRNTLPNSQNFAGAGWTLITATLTAGVTGPTGLPDAFTLTSTNAVQGIIVATGNLAAGAIGVNSWWIRRRTGIGTINLRSVNAATETNITAQVDGTWRRFSTPPIAATTPQTVITLSTIGDAVDIAYAQQEDVSGQSNQAPSEYVSVGVLAAPYHGNAVDGVKYFATTNGNSVPGANLILQSQTFDNAVSWGPNATTVAVNQINAPDGSLTADLITELAVNGDHYYYQQLALTAITYTASVYFKYYNRQWATLSLYADGSKPIYFDVQNGVVGNVAAGFTARIQALSNGWYRCSVSVTAAAATWAFVVGTATANGTVVYLGDVTKGVYVWGAQVEPGTSASGYNPTTTATVPAGNIVTEATGSLIPAATLLGYVAENAATNLCLQSQTFDNASWVKENATITANSIAAPDGTLTADTFTDNTTSGIHRAYQSITETAAPYTYSVYAKAGTLTWMQLVSSSNNSFYANFNLQTGVVGAVGAGAGLVATITALPNGWYRCTLTFTVITVGDYITICSLNANTAASNPAYVGTGQTMYLWGAQVEQSADCSSYVPTTTVAVTRNLDDLRYQQPSNASLGVGTSYTEVYPFASNLANNPILIQFGVANNPQFYYSAVSGALSLQSASGIVSTANPRVVAATNKNATAWGGATCSLSLNGGAIATGSFTTFTTDGNIKVDAPAIINAAVRNVKFYATRLTDAQLIDLTEDGVLTPDPEPPSTAAGHGGTAARYRRRRIEVEIDGEIFPVASEEEGRELLLKAREAAKQAAQAAAVRAAAKAEKKTSPAAVERALALSTPRISLRADDRSEALAQAIQAQVDAAQAAIDEDYATARRMAYAYVRQRLQDEQRQRELAADEEEVIAMILRLP